MAKVLTFEVGINSLENKIWRKIEITDQRTIKYDYRKYDIKCDNILLKGLVLEIKNRYEVED